MIRLVPRREDFRALNRSQKLFIGFFLISMAFFGACVGFAVTHVPTYREKLQQTCARQTGPYFDCLRVGEQLIGPDQLDQPYP